MNTLNPRRTRIRPAREEFRAWRWTLALAMALLAAAASDKALASTESAERLERVARDTVINSLSRDGSSVTARARVDARLKLPACGHRPQGTPPTRASGSTLTVRLQCNAPSRWTLFVPVETTRRGRVAVLSRALRRGEALSGDALRFEERDLNTLPYGHFGDAASAIGQVARRDLGAGAALTPRDLVPATLVRRGQSVTLIGRVGGIEVRARGTALAAGSLNQRIRVRNQHSRRVIEGLVRSPTEVVVPM